MSRSKVIRNSLVPVALAVAVCFAAVPAFSVSTARADVPETEETVATGYFKAQLVPGSVSVGIYETLEGMYFDGELLTGTATVDLVESGVLENRSYSQSVLTAEFSAGRDAFFMDYSSVFYTDGDLLTLRELSKSSGDYSITMGIGREETYFGDGFSSESEAKKAEADYWEIVEDVAAEAEEKETYKDKVYAAYSYVAEEVSYALEADAKAENVDYVRNPYGALVKGEACCEGYARAFKAILDVMGIPCVLVQGTFMSDDDGAKAHMWTYVRMDDNRWYMCDPTMQSGATTDETGEKYFLVNGRDELIQKYLEDGVMSLSSSAFDFYYPIVSGVTYTAPDGGNPFEIVENGAYLEVSYNEKGYVNAEKHGEYILVSYDSGTNWYYVRGALESVGLTEEETDMGTYFHFMHQNNSCTFAVTQKAYTGNEFFGFFEGTSEDIYDVSSSFGEEIRSTFTPYVVKSSAECEGESVSTRLSPEKIYTVTVTYSESLMLWDAEEVSVELMDGQYITTQDLSDDISIENVSWDGDKSVTFTFNTLQTYHSSLGYYFEIEGLVGKESKLAVCEVGFNVVNQTVFSCPYVEGSFNTVYATTPTLIADSDLSTEGWEYADGTSVADTTPHKFTLVVSSPSSDEEEAMADALSGEGTVAATYEITLGLCDKQVSYINGERVKVLIPFPEGYSYDSAMNGTTFKAYHFNDDGSFEEIDCVVTESGLIIYCEAFSPFAIVATEREQTERKAAVLSFGNGSVSVDILKLSEGQTETIKIEADDGYLIDSIVINGELIASVNEKECNLEISYDFLEAAGNYIEISYTAESVIAAEIDAGFHHVVTDEAETSSGLATWELVVIIIACVVVLIGVVVVVMLLVNSRRKNEPDGDAPGAAAI